LKYQDNKGKTCSISGCNKKARVKGLCAKCYNIYGGKGEEMRRVEKKFNKVIELFDEKTGEVVRAIRFRKPKDFNEFLKGFKAMRYPGYGWR
jgi:hypothetical protein